MLFGLKNTNLHRCHKSGTSSNPLILFRTPKLLITAVLHFQSLAGGGEKLKLGQTVQNYSSLKTGKYLLGGSSHINTSKRMAVNRVKRSWGSEWLEVWMTGEVIGPLTLQISFIHTTIHTHFWPASTVCNKIHFCAWQIQSSYICKSVTL